MRTGVIASLLAAFVFAVVVGFSRPAQAVFNGWPCDVLYRPKGSTPTYGSYGFLQVSLYSAPNCGGTYRSTMYLYSLGATSTGVDTLHLFSEAALMTAWQVVTQALVHGDAVQGNDASKPGQAADIIIRGI